MAWVFGSDSSHRDRILSQNNERSKREVPMASWSPGFLKAGRTYLDPPDAPFFCSFAKRQKVASFRRKSAVLCQKCPLIVLRQAWGKVDVLVGSGRLLVGQSHPFTPRFGSNISKMQKVLRGTKMCPLPEKSVFGEKAEQIGTPCKVQV